MTPINNIYISLLLQGFTVSYVNEIKPNEYIVVMRRGAVTTRSVLLGPLKDDIE